MSFGKQMRLRREELHLSRAALAEELGVSPSAISNYENGVSSPKEEVLLRLFDALEIDPNYLYRDSFRSGSFVCSRAEQDLIEKCRSLSPLERETVAAGTVQPGEPLRLSAEGTLACEAASLTVVSRRAVVCGVTEDGCDVLVRLLVADTEQHVSCMEKRLHLLLEPADGARLELLSVQPEEPVVTVTADGFQIRVTVTARTAALQESDLRQVTGATAQERACPYASVPSLTIVRWGGEDLWTLAKRYCSSERLIRETNGLTDDAAMAEAPQYLLIPKTQA